MEKFVSFFGLKLSFLVFSATEQLSVTLQSSILNAQEAVSVTTAAKNYLERLRSDSAFTVFFTAIVKEEGVTGEPTLPRRKKVPKRFDDGIGSHVYKTPADYYRRLYFEVLDLLTNEMKGEDSINQLLLLFKK